jgi:murein DD-endopeptidase MepM/ murein hydrolase activator NlpD
MLSVKSTTMVSLVAALATVGIATAVKNRPAVTRIAPAAATASVATVVPVAAVQPVVTRSLLMPVQGYDAKKLRDNFDETRGGVRRHEALDIMAARGTPVVATDDGKIAKLFRSVAGGITIYQFDPDGKFAYYYAHLDRYREGLK